MKSLLLFLFTNAAPGAMLPELESAAKQMTRAGILKHIGVLASDDFAGRFPGTPGEKKSVDYLVARPSHRCRQARLPRRGTSATGAGAARAT